MAELGLACRAAAGNDDRRPAAGSAGRSARAGQPLGVPQRRIVFVLGVASLCLLASVSIRLSPAAARWISVAGLLAIAAVVLAVRRMRPAQHDHGDRVALLPGPGVPDADAIEALILMLDEHRGFPAEIRSAIFTDLARLRRAPPAHRRAARDALQREVLAMLGDPARVRFLRALRAVGPAILALAFVVTWTLAYLLVWSLDADTATGAFKGFGVRAEPGDAMYLAVSAAVGGTPPALEARTNVAQTLIAAEFASGALLIGAYATSLMRAQRHSQGTRSSLASAVGPR